jgi:PAS domain S-box-containing protein
MARYGRVSEATRLASVRALAPAIPADANVLNHAVDAAAALSRCPISLITLLGEDMQWIKASRGWTGGRETSREVAFCAHTIRSPTALVVPDALVDARFARNPLVLGAPHIRFYAGVPLVLRDGAAVGALCVIDRNPRSLSDAEVSGLVSLAAMVTALLQTARDRADLVAAQEEAASRSAQLRTVMDAVPILIGYVDTELRYRMVNDTFARWMRMPPEAIVGARVDQLIPGVDSDNFVAHLRRAVAGEAVTFENLLTGPRRRTVMVTLTPDHGRNGARGVFVVATDITDRVRDEASRYLDKLRELNARQHEDREQSRREIARTLHDELGQELTGMRLQVEHLAGHTAESRTRDALLGMRDALVRVSDSVRSLVTDLRPAMLDDLGLEAAVEALAKRVERASGTAVDLDLHLDGMVVRDPIATVIFRILQAALDNVMRHAHATEVRVSLRRQGQELLLDVHDDGVGFDPLRTDPHSFGILGMRERCREVGGHMAMDSAPGRGAHLICRIPIEGLPCH